MKTITNKHIEWVAEDKVNETFTKDTYILWGLLKIRSVNFSFTNSGEFLNETPKQKTMGFGSDK